MWPACTSPPSGASINIYSVIQISVAFQWGHMHDRKHPQGWKKTHGIMEGMRSIDRSVSDTLTDIYIYRSITQSLAFSSSEPATFGLKRRICCLFFFLGSEKSSHGVQCAPPRHREVLGSPLFFLSFFFPLDACRVLISSHS